MPTTGRLSRNTDNYAGPRNNIIFSSATALSGCRLSFLSRGIAVQFHTVVNTALLFLTSSSILLTLSGAGTRRYLSLSAFPRLVGDCTFPVEPRVFRLPVRLFSTLSRPRDLTSAPSLQEPGMASFIIISRNYIFRASRNEKPYPDFSAVAANAAGLREGTSDASVRNFSALVFGCLPLCDMDQVFRLQAV